VAAGGRSRFGLSAEGANSAHYGSLATLNLEPRLLMPLSYVLLFVVCLCVAVAVCLLLLLRLECVAVAVCLWTPPHATHMATRTSRNSHGSPLNNERNSHGSPLRQAQLPQKNLRRKALEEHIHEVGVEVPQGSHAQSVIRHN
jgi:hypothetical protein